jgi:hypothetical protein
MYLRSCHSDISCNFSELSAENCFIKTGYIAICASCNVTGDLLLQTSFQAQCIVQCWGYLISSDHQLYSYSTQDAVRIGNSFITILKHVLQSFIIISHGLQSQTFVTTVTYYTLAHKVSLLTQCVFTG